MELEAILALAGSVGDKVTAIHDKMDALAEPKFITRKLFGSAIIPASPNVSPAILQISADSPAVGRCWNVRQVGVYGSDAHTPVGSSGLTESVTSPFAAGAGVTTVTLPAGASLTGIEVTASAGSGSGSVTVSVQNALGGTLDYQIPQPSSAVPPFGINYPGGGLAPDAAGGQISVSWHGVSTSGAGYLIAYYSASGASLPATVYAEPYVGEVPNAVLNNPGGADMPAIPLPDNIGIGQEPPYVWTAGRHTIWAQNRETVYALIYNPPPSAQLVITAVVEEWRISDVFAMRA